MSKILVSVVIPIYNSEPFLAKCIESVLYQSYKHLELILVNDGSKDGSGQICDDYAQRDDRIKVIHQDNQGRTEARARGTLEAKGEWVTFVDSDDCLPIDAVERLYAAATDDVDIVLGNGYALPITPCPEQIDIEAFRHLTVRGEGTIGVPWGSFYRRTLLTPWVFEVPRHIVNGEDYLFWLRLVFLTTKPVNVVCECVYDKGDEHTCNTFVWTADYCYELNELRKQSIPAARQTDFFSDMLFDRICNMFSVAVCCKRSDWIYSTYYQDILKDLSSIDSCLSLKQRLFFSLPSRRLRRLYSWLSQKLN